MAYQQRDINGMTSALAWLVAWQQSGEKQSMLAKHEKIAAGVVWRQQSKIKESEGVWQ